MRLVLSSRDRRALRWGVITTGAMLLWTLGVGSYRSYTSGVARLESERALLTSERHLIATYADTVRLMRLEQRWQDDAQAKLLDAHDPMLASAELWEDVTWSARLVGLPVARAQHAQDVEPRQGLTSVTFSIASEGTFERVLLFLRQLQLGPRLVHVDAVAIESIIDPTSGMPLLRLRAQLTGFLRPDVEAARAPGAGAP